MVGDYCLRERERDGCADQQVHVVDFDDDEVRFHVFEILVRGDDLGVFIVAWTTLVRMT